MPDLGTYALEVSLAYVGSLALLAGVVVLSVVQARRAKALLDEVEERQDRG